MKALCDNAAVVSIIKQRWMQTPASDKASFTLTTNLTKVSGFLSLSVNSGPGLGLLIAMHASMAATGQRLRFVHPIYTSICV